MNGFIGAGCGSFRLVRCRVGRNTVICICGILYAPMLEGGGVVVRINPFTQ